MKFTLLLLSSTAFTSILASIPCTNGITSCDMNAGSNTCPANYYRVGLTCGICTGATTSFAGNKLAKCNPCGPFALTCEQDTAGTYPVSLTCRGLLTPLNGKCNHACREGKGWDETTSSCQACANGANHCQLVKVVPACAQQQVPNPDATAALITPCVAAHLYDFLQGYSFTNPNDAFIVLLKRDRLPSDCVLACEALGDNCQGVFVSTPNSLTIGSCSLLKTWSGSVIPPPNGQSYTTSTPYTAILLRRVRIATTSFPLVVPVTAGTCHAGFNGCFTTCASQSTFGGGPKGSQCLACKWSTANNFNKMASCPAKVNGRRMIHLVG